MSVRDPLTKRQKEILDFIVAYTDEHDLAPTHEEIAAKFKISRPTAFEHVKSLQEKGRVVADRYKQRSIRLAEPDAESDAAPAAPETSAPLKTATADFLGVPVLGRVAAGRPIEAVEDSDPQQLRDLLPTTGCFALQVRGESMIDDQIRDGDFVILENRKEARNGETVVAVVDKQEATLKRWRRIGREVRLEPRNPAMAPIVVDADRVEICGVLVGLVRRY
jgi:repressor LexA